MLTLHSTSTQKEIKTISIHFFAMHTDRDNRFYYANDVFSSFFFPSSSSSFSLFYQIRLLTLVYPMCLKKNGSWLHSVDRHCMLHQVSCAFIIWLIFARFPMENGENVLSTSSNKWIKPLISVFFFSFVEIVKGTPYQGPEVDCWSLGVLLYTLVYGAMPFDGSNFKRLVKQISAGDYYEPKKPSNASPLIREMLTVCPKRRATIEQICNHW